METHAMDTGPLETDVLIAGAGPTGLSLALELAQQGHRCLVVERNDRVGYAPRAKTTNVRSRELLRRWGIADRLAAQSPFGIDYPPNVVFATRMNGHLLARFGNAFHGSPVRDARFSEHAQWIPQYLVEQVLKDRVAELAQARLAFSTRLLRFEESADGVEAVIATGPEAAAQTTTVRARYLVGADGARSTVRDQLGIRMQGISPLLHHTSYVFRAPGLERQHALGPALMYWLVNAELPCVVSPMDRDGRWTFGCAAELAQGEPAALIQRALGLDVAPEILSRDDWTAHQLIATHYREGRVFLAGDACHLHPPFGGFGMNMGIGDALDLGWKLSATLHGWGGDALLDSYETERRQIHQRVVDEAVANHAVLSEHLSLPDIEADSATGEAARQCAGEAIRTSKQREFDSLGVVLGSRYRHSPLLPPEAAGGGPDDAATDYRPQARPGCLAPHAWLGAGTAAGDSLYDHFLPQGFTLLVARGDGAGADADRFTRAAQALRLPLAVVAPAHPQVAALYPQRLALVRPDQFLAWCGDGVADDATALAVLARAAGHAPVPQDSPASAARAPAPAPEPA